MYVVKSVHMLSIKRFFFLPTISAFRYVNLYYSTFLCHKCEFVSNNFYTVIIMAFYLRILTFCVSFDNLIITTKSLNDDHSYELVSQIVSHKYDFSVRTMNDQSIGIFFSYAVDMGFHS